MTGLGILIAFFGYAILIWGIEAIRGNDQPHFVTYVFPWAK